MALGGAKKMIKKRNLDPSLVSWIMYTTGLGPGIGDIHYVADTASNYYQKLLDDGNVAEANIFTLPSLAHRDGVQASSNDLVLVMPGAYAETAQITWSKQASHMIGLGGPNIGGDYSENNVVIYTSTTAVVATMAVTARNAMFRNFVIENAGNHSTNVAAVICSNYGQYFNRVAFHGNMVTNQNDKASCCSLSIGAAGMYPFFEDCIIGQDVWGNRAGANSGALGFHSSGGRPNGGQFRGCQFLSVGNTATVALVAISTATATGRDWVFRDCVFQHFAGNATATQINQAFYIVSGAVQQNAVLLHNCGAFGIDEWQDGDESVVLVSMPGSTNGGGLSQEPTDVIAA